MKKILASVLAFTLAALTLCSCAKTSGGYKLLDVPDALSIDAKDFSEEVETAMLNMDESYPLLAAMPEENAYIYAVNPMVMQGVLVKYNGNIQYFPWDLIPELAQPEMYMADYNGDGQKDIAFTFVEASGETCYRETLHMLIQGEKKLEDYIYSSEKAASDAETHLRVEKKTSKDYAAYVDGKVHSFTMNGYGQLQGVYTADMQDFTLGEQITLEVNPGLVFEGTELPVYSAFKYNAKVVFADDMVTQIEPSVTF